jgi:seryl-tRNA(Sec) selenium transferase
MAQSQHLKTGGINNLCRKSGVDISRFGTFPVEKANDYSLLELHESGQILNIHGHHWKMPLYSSTGREQIRSSGTEADSRQ